MLGVVGTVYQLVCLRTYVIGVEKGKILAPIWLEDDPNLGRRQLAIRELYETLNTKLPKNIVVQHNFATRHQIEHMLYDEHQQVAADQGCVANFGGDPRACLNLLIRIYGLYEVPNTIRDLNALCRSMSIDVVVVTDWDTVWADRNSWVWRSTPLVANRFARAFACGKRSGLALSQSAAAR